MSDHIGNGGFRDLCDFFVLLKNLYNNHYVGSSSNINVKSYCIKESLYETILVKDQMHPLYLIDKISPNPWWEDVWDKKMIKNIENSNNDFYFWPGDKSLIKQIHQHVKLD